MHGREGPAAGDTPLRLFQYGFLFSGNVHVISQNSGGNVLPESFGFEVLLLVQRNREPFQPLFSDYRRGIPKHLLLLNCAVV